MNIKKQEKTMNNTLRPYQETAIQKVCNAFNNGKKNALIVLPTGLGKTICMASIAEKEVENNGKVLFLAHRNTLLNQGSEEIEDKTGVKTGILKNGNMPDTPIVIASVQAMSKDRLYDLPEDEFSLLMVDEAHHILADSYKKIVDHFSKAKLLGVTATPKRGDNNDISKKFDEVTSEYTLVSAINDGWLSPIHVINCPVNIDISNTRISAGDYAVNDIGEALFPYMEKIAEEIIDKAKGRKTLIFVPLVATAKGLKEIFISKGAKADYVAGARPDSPKIMESFKKGDIDILINSMLLTEGYNEPSVDCIVNLRVTRSETLLTQIIGRGTRKAPGKENLLILDFFWKNKGNRNNLSIADIIASDMADIKDDEKEDVIKRCKKNKDNEKDICELINECVNDVRAEREAALLRALKRNEEIEKRREEARRRRKEETKISLKDKNLVLIKELRNNPGYINILAKEHRLKVLGRNLYMIKDYDDKSFIYYNDSVIKAFGLDYFDYSRIYEEDDKITERQIGYLKYLGIEDIPLKSYGSYLIGNLIARKNNALCSYKQAKILYRKGIRTDISFKTASKVIDCLSANRWRVTSEVNRIIEKDMKDITYSA